MILSCKRAGDKKNTVDTLNDKRPKGGGKTHTADRRNCWLNRVPVIHLFGTGIEQEEQKRDGYEGFERGTNAMATDGME